MVAQWLECLIGVQKLGGSKPILESKYYNEPGTLSFVLLTFYIYLYIIFNIQYYQYYYKLLI